VRYGSQSISARLKRTVTRDVVLFQHRAEIGSLEEQVPCSAHISVVAAANVFQTGDGDPVTKDLLFHENIRSDIKSGIYVRAQQGLESNRNSLAQNNRIRGNDESENLGWIACGTTVAP